MSEFYDSIIQDLVLAYDQKVDERDQKMVPEWKKRERKAFLKRMRAENKNSLLEIGAGTGVHGKYFQDQGVQVTCTDLSLAMVKRCQEKGLPAHQMDFLHLDFPEASFDSVFAFNCLLHVPRIDLRRVLIAVRRVITQEGLFHLGQYGGLEHTGPWHGDHYEPKRFYSLLTDAQMRAAVSSHFKIESFEQIDLDDERGLHFQSLVLRKESAPFVQPHRSLR